MLLDQRRIVEVVDLHRCAYFLERLSGGAFGLLAALAQNFVYARYVLLPLMAAFAYGAQYRLQDVVQELLYLDVAQTAALVMLLQLLYAGILGPELGEVLGRGECLQIYEHRVALDLAGILHTQVAPGR